jgi:chorismate dehydratase
MRIGAVNYLNSKPLVYGLDALASPTHLSFDLPSRLADSLLAGLLDVALIPSVEFFRSESSTIVSDACIACRGPVLSVKLQFRVPPSEVRRVALDEGSRTSAALTRILLAEQYGIHPDWEPLPIGSGPEATDADAVLLIGDRAISDFGLRIADCNAEPSSSNPQSKIRDPKSKAFTQSWDLGERWTEWAGLPFVFAMWVARAGADASDVAAVLSSSRDDGVQHLKEIADHEGPLVGVSPELALSYFRNNLHFKFGKEERAGLRKFYALCVKHGLAPAGGESRITARGVPSFPNS